MKTTLILSVAFAALTLAEAKGAGVDGIEPQPLDAHMRVYRDLAYGPRGDLKEDLERLPVLKDQPKFTHTHRSGQLFDLYLPDAPGAVPADAPVLLFLHGGGWCMRWDKDSDGIGIIKALCAKGFVVCSADYQLQNDAISDANATCRPDATFADMLRDIDLAVSHLKTFLPEVGVRPRRIGIAGCSAGGHLASTYACDEGNPTWLGLGLKHALKIGYVLDIVGPVNFLTAETGQMLLKSVQTFAATGVKMKAPGKPSIIAKERFVSLLEWLTATDFDAAYRAGGDAEVLNVLYRWSPVAMVTPKTPPFLLAYNKLHPFSGTDGLVETANCEDMAAALGRVGVECRVRYNWFRFHGMFSDRHIAWMVENCLELAK